MIHVIRFAIHLIFLIYKPNNRIADVLVDFIKCFPPQKNGSYISFFKMRLALTIYRQATTHLKKRAKPRS